MLAIRLQRTGRKGHSQYRMIVQESRFSPKSAKVVFYLGSYDPHTKVATIDKDASEKYLNNGAQPSDRAATILKEAGVKLPKWYKETPKKKRSIKNPDKLRKNRPAESEAPATEPEEAQVEASATEVESVDTQTEESSTEPVDEVELVDEAEPAEADSK